MAAGDEVVAVGEVVDGVAVEGIPAVLALLLDVCCILYGRVCGFVQRYVIDEADVGQDCRRRCGNVKLEQSVDVNIASPRMTKLQTLLFTQQDVFVCHDKRSGVAVVDCKLVHVSALVSTGPLHPLRNLVAVVHNDAGLHALVDCGEHVLAIDLDRTEVEDVETVEQRDATPDEFAGSIVDVSSDPLLAAFLLS